MKICYCCKEEKEVDLFVKDKYTKDGYKYICLSCARQKSKERRMRNPEKEKEQQCQRDKENEKYFLKYGKYKEREKTRTREEALIFTKENKYKHNKANREKNKAYWTTRTQLGLGKIACREFRKRKRAENDTTYKMITILRSRLGNAIKRRKTKRKSTKELLGCEMSFFIKWIEKNFEHGMSWSSYGYGNDKWNIDHNLPCSSFNLADPKQQEQCFHWTNLFPMWQRHNFTKGSRLWIFDYEI